MSKTGKTYKVFARKLVTPGAAKIFGIPQLVDKLNDLGDAVEGDAVYEFLMHAALVTRDEIKDLAPYSKKPHPPNWLHIRDAIFASEGDPSRNRRGPSVVVGVRVRNAPQAFWTEYGTEFQAAQPWWRPGLIASRPAAASIIADGLKALIAKTTKGQ